MNSYRQELDRCRQENIMLRQKVSVAESEVLSGERPASQVSNTGRAGTQTGSGFLMPNSAVPATADGYNEVAREQPRETSTNQRQGQTATRSNRTQGQKQKTLQCFYCNEPNHRVKECSHLQPAARGVDSGDGPAETHMKIDVCGKRSPALLVTGCGRSLVPRKLVPTAKLNQLIFMFMLQMDRRYQY